MPNLAEKKKSVINQVVAPIAKNTLKNLTINTEKSSKTASVNEGKTSNECKLDSNLDSKSNKEDLSSNNASLKVNSNSTTPKNNVQASSILNIALGPTRNSYNKDLFTSNTNNTNNPNIPNNVKKDFSTTIDSKNREVAKEIMSNDSKETSKDNKREAKGKKVETNTSINKLLDKAEINEINIKEINENADKDGQASTSSRGGNKMKTLKIEKKSEFLNNLVGSLAKEGKQALDDKGKKKRKLIKHCADDPKPEEVIEESEPEVEKDDFIYKFKSDKEFYQSFCKKFYNDFKITSIKTSQFTLTSKKALGAQDTKVLVENYFDSIDLSELRRLQGILNRKIDMNEERMNVSQCLSFNLD